MLQVAQPQTSIHPLGQQQNKMANNKTYTSKSAPLVEKIRQRLFEEEWPKNSELYCEQDIERVRESEWFVKRFLLATRRNVDEAYEMLKTTLQWRCKHDLPNVQPNFFPREFYEIGGLFSYEPDREGIPVIYLRIRMHKKIKEIHEPVQQFLLYTIERVDKESNNNGCVIVFDCNDAGYSNMDLDLLRSLVDIAFKYFPFCIRYVIIYELSWMLNAVRKVAMTFIPASLASIVRFANKSDITQFIAPENLPDFMGGTCKRNYRQVPEGCRTVYDVAQQRGFTLEDAERIMAQFEPLLKEGREAIAKWNEANDNLIEHSSNKVDTESVTNNADNVIDNNNYDNEDEKMKGTNELHSNVTEESEHKVTTLNGNTSSAAIALVHSPALSCKSFANIASIYPQNVIHFKRVLNSSTITTKTTTTDSEPEKEENLIVTATIMIRNNHQNRSLAFKIKSNCSDQYSVTPSQGVLLHGAYISIHITGKNPALISQSEIQDKFLVLLSSNVDPQVHLKNSAEFNKLFVQGAKHVYVHKLKAALQWPMDAMNCKEFIKSIQTSDQTDMKLLINEVNLLKQKCHNLERRQSWLCTLIFGMLLIIIGLLVFCNNLDSDSNSLADLFKAATAEKLNN